MAVCSRFPDDTAEKGALDLEGQRETQELWDGSRLKISRLLTGP